MPFGRYACGVQRHIVLDGVPDRPGKWEIWGRTPQPKHAIAHCRCHLANTKKAILRIAKLLWFLLLLLLATTIIVIITIILLVFVNGVC